MGTETTRTWWMIQGARATQVEIINFEGGKGRGMIGVCADGRKFPRHALYLRQTHAIGARDEASAAIR